MEDLLTQRLNRPINGNRSSVVREVEAALATTVGLVREENEDRVVAARFYSSSLQSFVYCYILSDGMGGMSNGGLAATVTISQFLSTLVESVESGLDISLAIKKAVEVSNKKVAEAVQYKGGATLSAIVTCKSGELYTVNVGDSRIYQCLSNQSIVQVTEDDDVQSFLSKNGIEVNSLISRRNGLTKYIGMEGGFDFEVEHCVTSSDFFITSDGITLIGKDNLVGLYDNMTSSNEFLQRCIHLSNWFGGEDNATGIYVELSKLSPPLEVSENMVGYIEVWDCHGYILLPKSDVKLVEQDDEKTQKRVKRKPKVKKALKPKEESEEKILDVEVPQSSLFSSQDNDEHYKNDDQLQSTIETEELETPSVQNNQDNKKPE